LWAILDIEVREEVFNCFAYILVVFRWEQANGMCFAKEIMKFIFIKMDTNTHFTHFINALNDK